MNKFRDQIIKSFINFLRSISIYNYRKRIKLFIKNYHPDIKVQKELKNVNFQNSLQEFRITKAEKYWPILYSSINGIKSEHYIPESVYYFGIEPILNKLQMRLAYSDKNIYDKFLTSRSTYRLPTTVIRNINGMYYDTNYKPLDLSLDHLKIESGKYILKPSLDSGGGKDIGIIDYQNGVISFLENDKEPVKLRDLQEIFSAYKKDFILQKFIDQHEYFHDLNSTSVNTMRVMTYRSVKDDKIYIIQRIMKIGEKNCITDNEWTGSHTIGVNEDGYLNSFAVNKFGVKTTSINGIQIGEISKNNFVSKIDIAAKEIASHFFYSRLLGIDLAIAKDGGIVFVEANHAYNGINYFQYNNGPLFGDFYDEIIDYCRRIERETVIMY